MRTARPPLDVQQRVPHDTPASRLGDARARAIPPAPARPKAPSPGGGGRSVQHPARAGVGQGAPGVKPSPGSDGESGARRAPRPNPASGSARLCVESSIQFSRIPGHLPPSSVIYSHEMPQFPDCRKHLTGKSNSCCKFMFGSRGETIPEKKPNKSVRPEP